MNYIIEFLNKWIVRINVEWMNCCIEFLKIKIKIELISWIIEWMTCYIELLNEWIFVFNYWTIELYWIIK